MVSTVHGRNEGEEHVERETAEEHPSHLKKNYLGHKNFDWTEMELGEKGSYAKKIWTQQYYAHQLLGVKGHLEAMEASPLSKFLRWHLSISHSPDQKREDTTETVTLLC